MRSQVYHIAEAAAGDYPLGADRGCAPEKNMDPSGGAVSSGGRSVESGTHVYAV